MGRYRGESRGALEMAMLRERLEAVERRLAEVEGTKDRPDRPRPTVALDAGGETRSSRFVRRKTDAQVEPESDAMSDALTARLLAARMVLAGHTRAEVADHLSTAFGIEDTDDVLDAVGAASG